MVDGLDVGDHHCDQLRSAIGLVPQRAHLFSGSVADNVRFGKSEASDTEIWAALRVAAADRFVRTHPDGLQMPVRQGGVNLSGGQRQRIAIARAVIRRPAILLFDDAFSALDVHTQAKVWSALCDVSAEVTTLVVSQRVSLAARADQVIVMEAGRVMGAGKHDWLLDTCPAYAELADSQSLKATGQPR
jgi:ATP-binding cassette subfamily B protein